MAARSTGLFTREGFNLDAQMQVPENAGGTTDLLEPEERDWLKNLA